LEKGYPSVANIKNDLEKALEHMFPHDHNTSREAAA
jgi:hypothetical protein